jgi:hypothetical protein
MTPISPIGVRVGVRDGPAIFRRVSGGFQGFPGVPTLTRPFPSRGRKGLKPALYFLGSGAVAAPSSACVWRPQSVTRCTDTQDAL